VSGVVYMGSVKPTGKLSKLDVPSLVIRGSRDPFTPEKVGLRGGVRGDELTHSPFNVVGVVLLGHGSGHSSFISSYSIVVVSSESWPFSRRCPSPDALCRRLFSGLSERSAVSFKTGRDAAILHRYLPIIP